MGRMLLVFCITLTRTPARTREWRNGKTGNIGNTRPALPQMACRVEAKA
jgi:hypothetical protein